MMPANIQHLTSIIRQGEQANEYRAPYTWSATVRWMDTTAVELIGVDAPMTKTIWREVMGLLHELGIEKFLIHRIGDDSESWRWLKVKNYGEYQRPSSLHDLPESTSWSGERSTA